MTGKRPFLQNWRICSMFTVDGSNYVQRRKQFIQIRIQTKQYVEYSLLGMSPAPEFYKPTFRNSVSVPFSWVGRNDSYLRRKIEPTQSSETSAYKIQTPGKFPEDYILHSQHGEILELQKNMYWSLTLREEVIQN
jgi:hypothetical protein